MENKPRGLAYVPLRNMMPKQFPAFHRRVQLMNDNQIHGGIQ